MRLGKFPWLFLHKFLYKFLHKCCQKLLKDSKCTEKHEPKKYETKNTTEVCCQSVNNLMSESFDAFWVKNMNEAHRVIII